MSNNTWMARTVFIAPLFVMTLFWQDESCRSKTKVTTNIESQSTGKERRNKVRSGTWGGEHVGVEVTDENTSIEFDCAHGAIEGLFVIDRDGRFDMKGSYEVERPGPQRVGQASNARSARYTGSVNDTKMVLTVMLTDTNETIGTFTLKHGATPQIVKCL